MTIYIVAGLYIDVIAPRLLGK